MNIVNSQDPSVHATLFCLCHNNVVWLYLLHRSQIVAFYYSNSKLWMVSLNISHWSLFHVCMRSGHRSMFEPCLPSSSVLITKSVESG
jgi:hypothetical protein